MAELGQVGERTLLAQHPHLHRPEEGGGDAARRHDDVERPSGPSTRRRRCSVIGVGQVGLDLPQVGDDPVGVELGGAEGGHLGERLHVVREGEDRRADGLDDRLVGWTGGERSPEPLQAGVVVGEEQVVLRREVPVERPQGDAGVLGDLLGRGGLDALGLEPGERRPSQGDAGALAADRLRVPGHAQKVSQARSSSVNIDKTRCVARRW